MIDAEKVRMAFTNFRGLMSETARSHIESGEDAAAGILLVLERRVYAAMQDYAMRVNYPPGPDAEGTPVPPRRKSRKAKVEAQAELPEGEP